MKNFHRFAKLVNDQFMQLSKGELFTVDANKGDLWATYLAAFPPGTDPVYKVNTEHTCSCCRQFIHNIGGAVAITDTGVKTVWDVTGLEPTYQTVADAAALAAAAANKDKRQILLGALEAKEKQELATLSADEIRAQLNALA